MSHTLRERMALRPDIEFGPFRFLEALPWLVLAATMRVLAFSTPGLAIIFIAFATIAVLNAFIVVTQRSIELTGGHSGLGDLSTSESFRLSLTILKWTASLMVLAMLGALALGGKAAPLMLLGIDGMAFAQPTIPAMLWSAVIATLILLMIVEAGRRAGRTSLSAIGPELLRHGVWLLAGIAALTASYVALGTLQDIVRDILVEFWRNSPLNQLFKNLIMFVYIFSFAMLRLWMTLLVLTFALKQSYIRAR
ncbi:hypothetical protein [Tardiphaga sp.]|uniref:hypothetical protein n=1 Tax=Tardiphaga sp. TaxID=1926292 RepID=UPI002613C1F1|nr:hypothetical protein [Tardiphaga sp.]MDB5620894.1 hypothetical protein [Tardiphaga sp.]